MATVTKTIGVSGADYSSPQLWEAALDVDSSDHQTGVFIDGETYSNNLTFNVSNEGGGTITLDGGDFSPKGVLNGGVILQRTGGPDVVTIVSHNVTLRRLQIEGPTTSGRCVSFSMADTSGTTIIDRCIIRQTGAGSNYLLWCTTNTGAAVKCYQTIFIHDSTTATGVPAIYIASGGAATELINCIVSIKQGSVTYGIRTQKADTVLKNTIVTSVAGGTIVTANYGLQTAGTWTTTSKWNYSYDATAPDGGGGSDYYRSQTANPFNSTANGNYHWVDKATADTFTGSDETATIGITDVDSQLRELFHIGPDEAVEIKGSSADDLFFGDMLMSGFMET